MWCKLQEKHWQYFTLISFLLFFHLQPCLKSLLGMPCSRTIYPSALAPILSTPGGCEWRPRKLWRSPPTHTNWGETQPSLFQCWFLHLLYVPCLDVFNSCWDSEGNFNGYSKRHPSSNAKRRLLHNQWTGFVSFTVSRPLLMEERLVSPWVLKRFKLQFCVPSS